MDLQVSLHPHESLLLRLCRREAAEQLTEEQLRPVADTGLRVALLETAERHDVLGLILSTLARAEAARGLPKDQRLAVLGPLKLAARQSLLWDMERQRLAHVFAREGLDPVWLKGGALRGTAYSRSVERRIGDIDLLVAPEHFEGTVATLEAAGYESDWSEEEIAALTEHHFHLRLDHKAGYIVEVHWGLNSPLDHYQLDAEGFLRRSRELTPSDELRIRAPSVEDMVLHCAAQSIENDFASLRRLVDLDRILACEDDLDWELLAREAHRSRLSGVLGFTLQLTRSTLGTSLPSGFLNSLELPRGLRVHTALLLPTRSHVRQSFKGRFVASWLLRFWLTPNWRSRGKLLAGRLTNRDSPLDWLWHGQASPEEHDKKLLFGPWTVAKAAAFQLWLYLRSLPMLATARGRQELRFWSQGLRVRDLTQS